MLHSSSDKLARSSQCFKFRNHSLFLPGFLHWFSSLDATEGKFCIRKNKRIYWNRVHNCIVVYNAWKVSVFIVILVHISPHLSQNNSKYGHFLHSNSCSFASLMGPKKVRVRQAFLINYVKFNRHYWIYNYYFTCSFFRTTCKLKNDRKII